MKRGIYNLCGFGNLQADASLGLLPTCRMSTCFKGPSEGLQKVPFLVGGIPTPLKNMKVNWDDDIPFIYGKIIQSCYSHHQPATQ